MYKLLRRVLNDNDDSCLSSASLLNVQTNQLDVHRLLLFKKAIICFWEQVGGIVRTKQWIFSATCTIDNVRIKPKLNTNNNLKAGSLQKYKQRRHVYSDKRKKKNPSFCVNVTSKKNEKRLACTWTSHTPGIVLHIEHQTDFILLFFLFNYQYWISFNKKVPCCVECDNESHLIHNEFYVLYVVAYLNCTVLYDIRNEYFCHLPHPISIKPQRYLESDRKAMKMRLWRYRPSTRIQ